MHLLNLIRASSFRLTLLYTAIFCASALALLGFIYWSTVAVIEQQSIETIEAEIRGLAEQYNEQGLVRLIDRFDALLLEAVWEYHFDPQTNVIDVHISRLRAKIDKDFDQPLLHTIRGVGYSLRASA